MSVQKIKCFRCGKDTVVTDVESQEIFCSNCGIVIILIILYKIMSADPSEFTQHSSNLLGFEQPESI